MGFYAARFQPVLERLKLAAFDRGNLYSHRNHRLPLLRLMPLVESNNLYLVMLMESRGALQRLVKMATVSPWICEELAQYPVLLDEFLSMDFGLAATQGFRGFITPAITAY